jgi:cytochrome c peroxidase
MNFPFHRIVACAQASLVAAMLAACGGGSGTSAAAPTPDRGTGGAQDTVPAVLLSANSSGIAATFSVHGAIDRTNPFFKAFGNGRSCATCHRQEDGWSLTPASVLARFDATDGTDPLFLPLDGANSPHADVSTAEARRSAYSMLLSKAVIRMGRPLPASAEFELIEVDDPYGYAGSNELSLYRRPLPAANLRFLSSVMWDGRDTGRDADSGLCIAGTGDCFSPLDANLGRQANQAVLGHAQAKARLTEEEQAAIVRFESGLFAAQLSDNAAQSLTGAGAQGGPQVLYDNAFYFGINDTDAGDYRTGAAHTSHAMRMFSAWSGTSSSLADPDTPASEAEALTAARRSIARGQAIFNGRPIFIDSVGGMKNASVRGTCTTCHNAPNAGSRSTPLMFNLGIADASRRTSDLPLYTLRHKTTGATVQTTDPGAALVSGKWEDIGRFKVPVLRGLAARAPYFHNGSAADTEAVVTFYNERFKMGLNAQDAADLAAFLKAL